MNVNFSEVNKRGLLKCWNIERFGISANTLKIIAMVTMIVDHFAVFFLYDNPFYYKLLRGFGRISFPIFAFLIVEGFYHTSNKKRYAMRLGIFAIISEIPFDYAFSHKLIFMGDQNIYCTLLIGLLAIWALESIALGKIKYGHKLAKIFGIANLNTFARLMIMVGACGVAHITKCVYSYAGVFLIMCFCVFYKHHLGRIFVNVFFNMGMYGGMQSFGSLSIIPIALYNGKKGKNINKWIFYSIYPLHLMIFIVIRKML